MWLLTWLADRIAFLTVRRPFLLILAAGMIASVAGVTIFSKIGLDSEILNLLPAGKDTVRGLHIYHQEFSQGRTLVFAVLENSLGDGAEGFEDFVAQLHQQPWVLRVLDGSPLESAAGRNTLAAFATPLLFRLPERGFAQALRQLKPIAIRTRMEMLISQVRGEFPLARLQLQTDPLGILTLAVRPLIAANALQDKAELENASGSKRLVPVIIRQPSLSAKDSSRTMRAVNTFIASFVRTHPGLQVLVTGRSAYVDQVSGSMKRDFTFSSILSMMLISGLFVLGFRRLLPLFGSTLLLLLAALVALAIGSLLFGQLNVIAIAFGSILFGLGDDCSLLLYQAYLKASARGTIRREAITEALCNAGPSILCATVTNAIGFSALTLSGFSGFGQLGVLTAAGLGACALLMCLFLFLFIHSVQPPVWDPLQNGLSQWVAMVMRYPKHFLIPTVSILSLAGILALSSWRPLQFDTSPRSLEPSQIPAARTLQFIRSEFPSAPSPILVVVPARSPDTAAQAARQVDACLQSLGRKYSLPLPLISQPSREHAHAQALRVDAIRAARSQFSDLLQRYGFHSSAFASTFALLNFLEATAQEGAPQTWKQILPSHSPWWFLIDRFIASDSSSFIAFVLPREKEEPKEVAAALNQALRAANVTAYVSGLQETLDELVPWAIGQLWKFGIGVSMVILLVLAIAYRNLALWTLHSFSLVFSVGGLVSTLKLLDLPINPLNILAFPLILGVSVDYGTFLILAFLRKGDFCENITHVMKPILISALSSMIGFGCLLVAENPSLRGLAIVCSLGACWALITAFSIILPGIALLKVRSCKKSIYSRTPIK